MHLLCDFLFVSSQNIDLEIPSSIWEIQYATAAECINIMEPASFLQREEVWKQKKYLFASIEFLLRLRPPPDSWHTTSFQLLGNHPVPSKIKINMSLGWYFSIFFFFTQQVNKHLSIFSQWDHFQLQGTDYRISLNLVEKGNVGPG